MIPQRSERVEQGLTKGDLPEVLSRLTPADTFYLAAEHQRRYPGEANSFGAAGTELASLLQRYPNEVNWERLSRDFGVPHPVLAQSYARELLNLPPFPVFMGYASRLLAETWDSNNLYWARLADEKNYSPVMLNRLVPDLTRRMVEKIFATDFEDWPALLRATRETGEEFRQGKIAALSPNGGLAPPAIRCPGFLFSGPFHVGNNTLRVGPQTPREEKYLGRGGALAQVMQDLA